MDLLFRELKVNAATLSSWCDVFLANGMAGLKRRDVDARDEKISALQKALGETTPNLAISNEIKRVYERKHGPFSVGEIDELRRSSSISLNQMVPLKSVCAISGVARSSVYWTKKAMGR